MLIECEPEEFFKDDGGTCDIKIVAEKAFLVRDTDLLGKILEGLVRRTIEKSLPVLELDLVDVRHQLPEIDLVPLARLLDHLFEGRKRENTSIEGVDDLVLAARHLSLERLKIARVGRSQPDERGKIDIHIEASV